jgi:phosphatidylserine decarboxylase
VPTHKEGWRFIAIFAVITLVLTLVWKPVFWPGLAVTIWCYSFFRDPVRSVPQREGLIVSPADGVVSLIVDTPPSPEIELGDHPRARVSVFMNVFNCHVNRAPMGGTIRKVVYFNCHVNRAPMGGTIRKVVYHSGKFLNASLDKASEHNERNAITIESAGGRNIGVVQIAGLVARRILCLVSEGQAIETGERFGLIRFGSRLDIYLPVGVQPMVCLGQTTVAGETVLADPVNPQERRKCKEV